MQILSPFLFALMQKTRVELLDALDFIEKSFAEYSTEAAVDFASNQKPEDLGKFKAYTQAKKSNQFHAENCERKNI